MSKATKFALLNSMIGFLIGIYIAFTASGNGYWIFIIGAPVSAFVCGFYFWRLIAKTQTDITSGKIIISGLLTGSVSHYLCWVLLNVGMNICYWITGNCTGSLGSPPANILQGLMYGFVYTGMSLVLFGWITIPMSVGIGFLMKKINKNNTGP